MITKISVIMPVYNGGRYLKDSVESILNQTFKDFEFIIIDDGSIDNTWNILEEFCKSDDRIKLLKNSKNMGIVYSLNRGLNATSSNIIARMDCGDICDKIRLYEQWNYLSKNLDVILVTSQAYWINSKGDIVLETSYSCDDYSIKKDLYLMKNNIIHPATMFRWDRRSFYRDFTYPAEDYDLWLRFFHLGSFCRINAPLIKIRDEGISFNNRIYQAKTTELVRQLFIERLTTGKESQKTINRLKLSSEREKYRISKLFKMFAQKGLSYKKKSLPWLFYMSIANLLEPLLLKHKIWRMYKEIIINFLGDSNFDKMLGDNTKK